MVCWLVLPVRYFKGVQTYAQPQGPWRPSQSTPCSNEDLNNNGILDPGEDFNSSGRLEPGIPVSVTTNVVTDANGRATVSLVYPRDRVYWLDVNLTIRGQAQGSEPSYTSLVHLLGLSADYGNQAVPPPGELSPYGVLATCTNSL